MFSLLPGDVSSYLHDSRLRIFYAEMCRKLGLIGDYALEWYIYTEYDIPIHNAKVYQLVNEVLHNSYEKCAHNS